MSLRSQVTEILMLLLNSQPNSLELTSFSAIFHSVSHLNQLFIRARAHWDKAKFVSIINGRTGYDAIYMNETYRAYFFACFVVKDGDPRTKICTVINTLA